MLGNFKLGTKIIGGFGVVSLLALIMATLSWNSLSTLKTGYEDLLSQTVSLETKANLIDVQTLQCRRREKDFLSKLDMKYVQKHDDSLEQLLVYAESVEGLARKSGLERVTGLAGEIKVAAQDYSKAFHSVVSAQERRGLRPDQGYQNIFRTAAHKLAAVVSKHEVEDLKLELLMIRRYEKDFKLTGKDKYKNKWNTAIATFKQQLEKSECPPDVKSRLQSSLQSYTQAHIPFLTMADDPQRDVFYNQLRGDAHEIENALASVYIPQVRALILEIRKQEKDYMLRYQFKDAEGKYAMAEKYSTKTRKAVDNLRATCETAVSSGLSPKYAKAIYRDLDIYKKAFNDLVQGDITIRDHIASMTTTIYRIDPLVNEIVELSNQANQTRMADMERHAKKASMLVKIIGTLTVGLGMLLGIFLTRGIIGPIRKVIDSLGNGSDQIRSAAAQMSQSSQQLAAGASEQAASLEETSAAMIEMSSLSESNASNSGEASKVANRVLEASKRGKEAMNEMNRAMEDIKGSAIETAKIIKTIDEIAFQTNLLALNAAVEAARAGDAGKGFAVVADEVRNLASRSAEAAKNTATLIEESNNKSDTGIGASRQVNNLLDEIVSGVGEVTSLITEVSSNIVEQSQGVDQLNTSISRIDHLTQSNAASAEEVASTSEELSAQTMSLNEVFLVLLGVVEGATHKPPQQDTWLGDNPVKVSTTYPSSEVSGVMNNPADLYTDADLDFSLDQEDLIEV